MIGSKNKEVAVVDMPASQRRKALAKDPRLFFSRIVHDHYIVYPLIAAGMWLAGILALLILWAKNGKPKYEQGEASVVFVSDVGAYYHKFFIIITAITGGMYILSLFSERWLRHVDRIPGDHRKREKIFDWLAVFFCVVGAAGLILLGVFDAFAHSTVHWSMTVVFIVGTALSAIFQSGEVWSLHKDHPDRAHLFRNAIFKLVIVGLAVALAIAFGVCYGLCGGNSEAYHGRSAATCNRITSAAASLEWSVSFVLVFYFLTLALDLWPAGKSSPRYMRRLARWQEQNEPKSLEHDFTGRPQFGQYPQNWENENGRAADVNANHGQPLPMSQVPVSARPSTTYSTEPLVRGQEGVAGRAY